MMISPENYYRENLRGKSIKHIQNEISELRENIKELKNKLENPALEDTLVVMDPSYEIQLDYTRKYLQQAIGTLIHKGGVYKATEDEMRTMDFNQNVEFINKIELSINHSHLNSNHVLIVNVGKNIEIYKDSVCCELPMQKNGIVVTKKEIDKKFLCRQFEEMYIGEWLESYQLTRLGPFMHLGRNTNWELIFHFSNGHEPRVICGYNNFPYNFHNFLSLFGAENIWI